MSEAKNPSREKDGFGNVFVGIVIFMLIFKVLGVVLQIVGMVSGANKGPWSTSIILLVLGLIMLLGYIEILYQEKWGVYMLGISALLAVLVSYWAGQLKNEELLSLIIPGIIIVMAIMRWKEFKKKKDIKNRSLS
jgi:hypothetical protein